MADGIIYDCYFFSFFFFILPPLRNLHSEPSGYGSNSYRVMIIFRSSGHRNRIPVVSPQDNPPENPDGSLKEMDRRTDA